MKPDTPETEAWKQTAAFRQISEQRANRIPRLPGRDAQEQQQPEDPGAGFADWLAWGIVGSILASVLFEALKKFL